MASSMVVFKLQIAFGSSRLVALYIYVPLYRFNVCMCVVCICVYVTIHIRIHVSMYYAHIQTDVILNCVYVRMHVTIFIYMYIYMCRYMNSYPCKCLDASTQLIQATTRTTVLYPCIHSSMYVCRGSMYVCVWHACVYTYSYAYVYRYLCIRCTYKLCSNTLCVYVYTCCRCSDAHLYKTEHVTQFTLTNEH